MCLMCGNGFTGPPNTTNATKHLRCKHKHEYLLYFDLLEGAKQGTFFGDVHQSIREVAFQVPLNRFSVFFFCINSFLVYLRLKKNNLEEETVFVFRHHFTKSL